MKTDRGFTLLELLLAVTLLAILTAAMGSWFAHQLRVTALAKERMEACEAAVRAARVIDDDVIAAMVVTGGLRYKLDAGSLVVMTINRFGSDPAGVHRVVWSFDPDRHLLLRSTAETANGQTVWTERLTRASFVASEAGSLTLRCGVPGSPDSVVIPIWSERR